MIGRRGERGSGISVQATRDDDDIYICGAFNKFPDFFVQAFKIVENSLCYCYTSYEMTDQFL